MRSATTEVSAMIIVRDIFSGIQSHFRARATEWIMAVPTGLMALGLSIQPNMFSSSTSYRGLAQFGNEMTWMWVILFCFFARMVALVVNGTFRSFQHSPHLRVTASFICFNFWSWMSYGFVESFFNNGSFFAVPASLTLLLIEGLNIYRGTTDVGVHHAELKRAGKWTGKRSPFRKS